MNVEERIQRAADDAGEPAYSSDSDDLGKAGAYPMNVIDRINSARPRVRSSIQAPAPRRQTPAANQTTARPDAWRYRWHRNQWWYYTANSKWLYWSDGQWKPFNEVATVSTGK